MRFNNDSNVTVVSAYISIFVFIILIVAVALILLRVKKLTSKMSEQSINAYNKLYSALNESLKEPKS